MRAAAGLPRSSLRPARYSRYKAGRCSRFPSVAPDPDCPSAVSHERRRRSCRIAARGAAATGPARGSDCRGAAALRRRGGTAADPTPDPMVAAGLAEAGPRADGRAHVDGAGRGDRGAAGAGRAPGGAGAAAQPGSACEPGAGGPGCDAVRAGSPCAEIATAPGAGCRHPGAAAQASAGPAANGAAGRRRCGDIGQHRQRPCP